jgi:Amidohydrolase family
MLKKVVKICFGIFLGLVLVLFFGVWLPDETYLQKEDEVTNLLITNCNIVDVRNGSIIPNCNVLVQNGKIISIDSVTSLNAKNVKEIDANGKYLIPSLWDMHLHTLSLSPQLHFPLLIANGVTGVRDMGDGDSWISDIDDVSERDKTVWERQSKEENLLIPKIIEATSYHVEELENTDTINFKEKIAELVSKLKARGEPFVKVQLGEMELPDYLFYELQHQARNQNIPVLGHLSPNLDVNQVMDNGFRSIEHAWALIPHFVKVKKDFRKDIEQKLYWLKNQDSLVTQQVLAKISSRDVYYVPTHVTSNKKEYLAFEPDYNHNINNVYTERVQLSLWKLLRWLHIKGYNQETDMRVLQEFYYRGLEVTRLAHKNGVKILAGTDALDRNVYYGISLHDELGEMVKAGLSNAEALKTATYNAAEYFSLTDEYGSIEVGKRADFVLLKQNPLEKIEHTKTIFGVYYNARWYAEEDIEAMKDFVRDQARSFRVSCKFIWNLVKQS